MSGAPVDDMVPSDRLWSAVSYGLGTASVLIWLCAQMPQILKNWRRRSVEGLSSGFLAAWVAGDVTNLLGCLLTGQLGVQILLASYYCIIDLILLVQFWAFRQRGAVEVFDGFDPAQAVLVSAGPAVHDNSNSPPRRSSIAKTRDRIASLLSVGMASSARGVSAAPTGVADVASGPAMDLGFFVAYFSMVMYVTSRWPQIWHNFKRKSTTGVSMLLFMSAFMGNLTYTLSIVLSPQSVGAGAHRREFLLRELPYIVGAAGTMLFDCIILGQWYYYHRILSPHRRRSTECLDRISRPYMGTPASRPASTFEDVPERALSGQERLAARTARHSMLARSDKKTPLVLSHQSVYGASADSEFL